MGRTPLLAEGECAVGLQVFILVVYRRTDVLVKGERGGLVGGRPFEFVDFPKVDANSNLINNEGRTMSYP